MRRHRGDRGQASVQYAGFLPAVLVVFLLCLKIYVTMTTIEQVDNAARTGAREASKNHNLSYCPTKAMAALPRWLTEKNDTGDHLADDWNSRARATVSGDPISDISCRVQAKIPVLWQSVPLDFTVDRTVHMPG